MMKYVTYLIYFQAQSQRYKNLTTYMTDTFQITYFC